MSSGHYRLDEWSHKNVGTSGISIALRRGESPLRGRPKAYRKNTLCVSKTENNVPPLTVVFNS